MGDSNGAIFGGVNASSKAEMRAFDSLPADVRTLLNYASINYSAVQLAYADPPRPPSTGGGFTVSRPARGDTRGELIQKIRDAEAHIAPMREPPRTKVAHATLRPVASRRMFVARSRLG